MIHLVNKLINFGFTRTDAQVYISLLKNGRSSGYKIAKKFHFLVRLYTHLLIIFTRTVISFLSMVKLKNMKQNLLNSYFHKLKKALLTI